MLRGFSLRINLVQIRADAEQNPAGADWGEATFVKTLAELHDMFDTVGLGHEASATECVHVKFSPAGLVTAEKMAGQPDADHRQPQALGQE